MKILLATDGSQAARDAEWLLERIPFEEPVDLTIAHVETIPSLAHLKREFPSSVQEVLEQFHAQAERLVADEVTRFEGINGTVEGCIRQGHSADVLTELAEEKNSDLVVIGARGQSPASQFLLGSTSQTVANHVHCSVLVTRSSDTMKDPKRSFRIVVAYDASETSKQAVQMLAAIPWGEGVEILALSILPISLHYGDSDSEFRQAVEEKEKAKREDELQWAIDQLLKTKARVSGQVIRESSVSEALLNALKRLNADLVVLGNRGINRIQRLILGSTSDRVLRHANCSVWIHRKTD